MSDQKSKLIAGYHVTAASVHDSGALELLLKPTASGRKTVVERKTLYVDAVYRSVAVEQDLVDRNIKSRIHYKTARNCPLTVRQERAIPRAAVIARG
jgi:citrate lyase gamma subunit